MAITFSQGEKNFCRVHKNQAVNLLQIPIHGQIECYFLNGGLVKFNESRIPIEFDKGSGHG